MANCGYRGGYSSVRRPISRIEKRNENDNGFEGHDLVHDSYTTIISY